MPHSRWKKGTRSTKPRSTRRSPRELTKLGVSRDNVVYIHCINVLGNENGQSTVPLSPKAFTSFAARKTSGRPHAPARCAILSTASRDGSLALSPNVQPSRRETAAMRPLDTISRRNSPGSPRWAYTRAPSPEARPPGRSNAEAARRRSLSADHRRRCPEE